jgi:ERCC4-related helicase
VGSDHNLVIAKIKLKIASDRDMKSYMKSKRTDAEKLNTPEIKE